MDPKLPFYLQQSHAQLATKFKQIKLLEDERIHDVTIKKDESNWSVSSGIEAFELKRNRYMNILPWDKTRVKLNVTDGFNDFINASNIELDLNNHDFKSSKQQYISTQGPTKNTVDQFWQMIIQQSPMKNVVICMVTPLQEHGVTKCFKYWCDVKDDLVKFQGDDNGFEHDLELKCIDSVDTDIPGVTYTTLSLKSIKDDTIIDEKIIHHLYYDKWTDFSKPEDWKSIYQLTKLARGLNDDLNKLIVHCSAGVGRTGTFITLDYLFNSIDQYDNSQDKDLIEIIVQILRTQRMMMVQSQEQFLFIYDSLKRYLLGV
ncbi:Receptor-type tyrosine-protein phosphatase S [Wickerhamomyces ciferrii]|uniref:Receptor-type tyrosine-protein phosphatase S n=1 Tax=Wickerhamomyces ciferrii (strain ATCC 14091 / BCRC 22168 / CBS 111 / JCM 3599 / NBRC 0793 / NRRL Y-1031 F-60-10) TaxID=1206466 RepID=K0KYA7_WICCF|nr:Receptor-type tyrosine-protein phosphatase S [Wickerhamomyces ciferrii]CCH47062.1 Receptor-type tyrosine-protein phosphatase S [Wickerhamomyces ciferrii]